MLLWPPRFIRIGIEGRFPNASCPAKGTQRVAKKCLLAMVYFACNSTKAAGKIWDFPSAQNDLAEREDFHPSNISQLIHAINCTESSERFHKESCGMDCQLVIIFCRGDVGRVKPVAGRGIFPCGRPDVWSVFYRVVSEFTAGFGGLKAFCNVSNFSEMDQ
jgi:hypothetical protein